MPSSGRFSPSTVPQGLYEVSASQLAPLGSTLHLSDGRVFKYAKAGATALLSGRLVQEEIPGALHGFAGTSLAVNTGVAGDRTLTVTPGATAVTENQYAEGYLVVMYSATAGAMGDCYKIAGHPAADASTAFVVTLADPLYATLLADAEVAIRKHPCKDVIITTAPITGSPIGVPIRDVPLSNYFWCQTQGLCGILADGTLVNGNIAGASDGVAGAVAPLTPASDENHVGDVSGFGVTAEFAIINLRL